MTTTDRARRRPRRIAADEAHAWARNLRLNNPHAKLTLSMLSLYVDGDGYCFVGIPTLAEDTELSAQTVRSRLAWLEEIGAIARLPQWTDEYGRRNGEGRGKRTSDLIRLMVDQDEAIEAAIDGVSREVSPMPQTGLNPEAETVSPAPALRQPYDSAEGLNSEPEPESPLNAPQGARERAAQVEEPEPEDFVPAWQAWRGHEVMRRDLALAEFKLLSPDKQRLCRAAIEPFNQAQSKLRRTTNTNFHLWIRSRGFEEFPNATLAAAPPSQRWIRGDELAALTIAMRMAGRGAPRTAEHPEFGTGLWRLGELPRDLAALAAFAGQDPASWHQVELGSAQFAAWRDRLQAWLGGEVAGDREWSEPYDPAIHAPGCSTLHPNFKLRKSIYVLRIPAPWPPHRDGTWSAADDEGQRA